MFTTWKRKKGHLRDIEAIFWCWMNGSVYMSKNGSIYLSGKVYASFVFYVSFIFNLVACGISYLQTKSVLSLLPLPSCQTLLIISGVSLFLGFLFYKLSCPLHRFYGEYFKSIFDLNKNSILEIGECFGESERNRMKQVFRYLQYHKIKCPKCGELSSGYSKTCENGKCGVELPEVFKEILDTHESETSRKDKSTGESTTLNKFFKLFKGR